MLSIMYTSEPTDKYTNSLQTEAGANIVMIIYMGPLEIVYFISLLNKFSELTSNVSNRLGSISLFMSGFHA
jgi:hypothetical protein